jgi:hypothetical protein
MTGRVIIVLVLALIQAWLIVRNAFVDAYAISDPAKAATVWPGHPTAIVTSGLEQVGAAAAANRSVDPALVRRLVATAAKAPLAPEPFLVRGVEARLAGQEPIAASAFLAARSRNPRSVAARYFLADHYLRAGDTRHGLAEISTLTRLVPGSQTGIAPHLAAFARNPGAAGEIKAVLREQPQLESVLLSALASDSKNSRLVLALWSGRRGGDLGWQERLVNTLVTAGRYQEARAAWARFNPGARLPSGLSDPKFEARLPPPFGWALGTGAAGVAEPAGAGRLHILYYGRDNLVLAGQLLMLEPGPYRLSMRVGGPSPPAKSLSWTLACLSPRRELASVNLASARNGQLAADFFVPAGCPAQQLELAGTAPELPEEADVTIGDLRLEPRRGR